jgi:hypothetical protein
MGPTFAILVGAMVTLGEPPAPPFVVERATPRPDVTRLFTREDGWTGADGAYSVRLGPDRLVWLFSDTWLSTIENGRRKNAKMVNNTVGVQSLRDPRAPLQFYWGRAGDRPAALLTPANPDHWYWPEGAARIDDGLLVFCKLVRRNDRGAPGFQFDWFANELLRIGNPDDDPPAWTFVLVGPPPGVDVPRLGAACVVDGDFLYVYGLFPSSHWKAFHRPLTVARVPTKALAVRKVEAWEYWCRGPAGGYWSSRPENLVPLFTDAAPEMSVGTVRGLTGFVATYTRLGLGPEIVVRHAPRPEGPWSAPLTVYRCPPEGRSVFFYGSKAHPDLADRDGQLVITWCRNTGDLSEHMRRPDLYVPQGVEVTLRPIAPK